MASAAEAVTAGAEKVLAAEAVTAGTASMIENEYSVAAPALAAGACAFVFIAFLYTKLAKFETGTDIGVPVLDELSLQVKSGAIAFLKTEYTYLCFFVIALALTLFGLFYATDSTTVAFAISLSFVFGASLSAGAGWWGMMVATDGNAKTTAAAAGNKKTGKKGSLTGVTICYMVLSSTIPGGFAAAKTMQCLAGFGFGASSIALFARVAGGIYAKAADVGADLVGKVEAGIDEDDPHNPAVIADNVGDNVGDVAGMGADLFESYVGSIIAAGTLAGTDNRLLALPLMLSALGIFCSLAGYFMVGTKEEGKGWDVHLGTLMWGLEKGMYTSAALFTGLSALLIHLMFGGSDAEVMGWKLYLCIILGLISGAA